MGIIIILAWSRLQPIQTPATRVLFSMWRARFNSSSVMSFIADLPRLGLRAIERLQLREHRGGGVW